MRIPGLFHDLTDGFAEIHKKGLSHGDFKPANAVLGMDGRAKIIDLDDLEPTGIGQVKPKNANSTTWIYKAPEMWYDPPKFDLDWQKGDVYSLGMSMLEMRLQKPFSQIYKEMYKVEFKMGDVNDYSIFTSGQFYRDLPNYLKRMDLKQMPEKNLVLSMLNPDNRFRPNIITVQQELEKVMPRPIY